MDAQDSIKINIILLTSPIIMKILRLKQSGIFLPLPMVKVHAMALVGLSNAY